MGLSSEASIEKRPVEICIVRNNIASDTESSILLLHDFHKKCFAGKQDVSRIHTIILH